MTPNKTDTTTIAAKEIPETKSNDNLNNEERDYYKGFKREGYRTILGTYVTELKWFNILILAFIHCVFLRYVFVAPYCRVWRLIPYGVFTGGVVGLGIGAGAHRLWCHRAYKATLPLRIFLMLCFATAGMNPIFEWVRDHRVHHKFSETDADPHNSKRGFFFAHMGWLMMKKHPEVLRRGKEVDMSDILADPVVRFHQKYFIPLNLLMCFVIPTIIPLLWWGEDWWWTFMGMCLLRWMTIIHCTSAVNSAAHLWGMRPYDRKINPVENLTVSVLTMGEGWHNYHHTFPWDYKASELGKYNLTTFWIHVFAKIGWAYELKTPSKELIKRTIEKAGDGSHSIWGHEEIPESAELVNNKNNYQKIN